MSLYSFGMFLLLYSSSQNIIPILTSLWYLSSTRSELITGLQLPFQRGPGAGFGTCYVNSVTVHQPVNPVQGPEEGAKKVSRPLGSGEEMCFKQIRGMYHESYKSWKWPVYLFVRWTITRTLSDCALWLRIPIRKISSF